jgi:MFS family permease
LSIQFSPGRQTSRIPPLLRETAFRRYWGAQSISLFGDQVSAIALPLAAVLALHASPAEMGYLSALIWLPSLLFALHAGAWVDRRGHRRATMIAADLGRAALLASIPVCSALGVLSLAQVFAVAFTAGTLSIFFTVSDAGLFVSLVPSDQYVEGNSLIYQSRALAAVGGPNAGGLLVQALSAPFALAAEALSFLGSAFFLSRIHPAEPAPDRAGRRRALSAGARFIWTSPILRPSLACVSVINFFNFMFMALFVLYATRSLHVRPGLLGMVLGAGAVGGVLGSLLTRRIASRAGVGRAYLIGCIVYPVPVLFVPLAAGPRLLILGMLFTAEFSSQGSGDDPWTSASGRSSRLVPPICAALRGLPRHLDAHPPGAGAGRRGRGHADRGAPGALDRRRGRDPGLPVPASLAAAPLPPDGTGETGPASALAHGLGAVQGLPDDVGVPGVLRGFRDHVQQHPAGGPARPLLEPGRLGQWMRRVQVGQGPDQVVGALRHLVVIRQQPGQRLALQHPESIHVAGHV